MKNRLINRFSSLVLEVFPMKKQQKRLFSNEKLRQIVNIIGKNNFSRSNRIKKNISYLLHGNFSITKTSFNKNKNHGKESSKKINSEKKRTKKSS
jgi:hypothetical protein